ncbi:helix-turn-helix domain-containing protein [Pseudactinotalea sp.]|uniref:helix-turn-helix domain-containing protein n=1 Tax=Pseudactinotalea sp. TaxID=1926260 RepID=UPI003B3A071E
MAEQVTDISRAVSDKLTGAYASKRLTQEEIADRAHMSIWTLQKKLRGRAPITATDLVVISQAIGVSPTKILTEALEEIEEQKRLVSAGVASMAEHRKKRPSEMTEEELDAFKDEGAANTDDELGHDQPQDT